MTTTVPIKKRPALYLQPIGKSKNYRFVSGDQSPEIRSVRFEKVGTLRRGGFN